MSKAVLVMDMPNSCMGCNFLYCDVESNVDSCQAREISKPINLEKEDKPDWCPLRPMPDKNEILHTNQYQFGVLGRGFSEGWNACIDKILGGVE